MKKIHLKKRKKKIKLLTKIIITTIIAIILLLYYFNYSITPKLMSSSTEKIKYIITNLINDTINDTITPSTSFDKLFITTNNEEGYTSTIDFNTKEVNRILSLTVKNISDRIEKLENTVIYKIPIGVSFQNTFLSNLLPKIPVKLQILGSVISNIKTDIKNYGINGSMIEVKLSLELSLQILLPFESANITLNTDVPIAIKIVQGKVPNVYGYGFASSIENISE